MITSSAWPGVISLSSLVGRFTSVIALTWLLVAVENILLVCVPLLIGFTVDSLLENRFDDLIILAVFLFGLVLVAVLRRIYDTRTYGSIRVVLGCEVNRRLTQLPISTRNARLDMARELVDFLEEELPSLFSGIIQIVASIVILVKFGSSLAVSALIAAVVMLVIYSLFHRRYLRLNSAMNHQMEQQVAVIQQGQPQQLFNHLRLIRRREVQLSDTDALMYGLIFSSQFAFVLTNLWLAITDISTPTAGAIFSIVSYSWAFVEAALVLPLTLQSLSRLLEITQRINSTQQELLTHESK